MLLVALSVAVVATVVSFCFFASGENPVSADSVSKTATVQPPVVPGAGAAYLGAFVDPNGTALTPSDPTGGTASLQAELRSLPEFNERTGRPPAILSTFQNWGEPADVAGIDSVAATGALPMVTWSCGDSDARVAAGLDDAAINAEAQDLAAADVPVLFRWFPDPNLTGQTTTSSCLGTEGAAGYVAAYRHVRSLFQAAGATNVAFVWSVDTATTADQDLAQYYPGGDVVDWVAADAGATSSGGSQGPAFSAEFGSWYSSFVATGKPMMLSSTGIAAGSQAAYLGQVLSEVPDQYPQIKALVYFDAPDALSGQQDQLDTAGSASFGRVGASPYFNPTRSPSATIVSASQSSLPAGNTLVLTAAVTATDNSGSVSFLDNGTSIAGCVFVPITAPVRCETPRLSAGQHAVTAFYSGDTAFSPSTSAPATVTVDPPGASSAQSGTTAGAEPKHSSALGAASGAAGQARNTPQSPALAGGSALLGSFVDPSGSSLRPGNPTGGIASLPSELAALPAVDQTLGRPLSIISIYLNWRDSITVTELDQVIAAGGTPMITWNCGSTDSRVLAGRDDRQIDQLAAVLADFQFPVFLRWFPDPNANTIAGAACLGSRGAAGYVAAYQHIHDTLMAAGATNVTYVWSVDTTTSHASGTWRSWYPGAQYVNVIGADGYATSSATANISDDFGSWYASFSADKPLMISQTGAIPNLQAQYIAQLSTIPARYPLVRAVVYFDAPDVTTGQDYALEPQSAGAQSLQALSALPGFQPARTVTTTSVTASTDLASLGQVVHLSVQVENGDQGGNLTFSDNGSLITGCGAVPVRLAASCDTSSLSAGDNQIVVDYSGDALSGASESVPIDVVVGSTPSVGGPPAIPGPGRVYLGAWVRPQVTHAALAPSAALDQELSNLPSFNGGLARPLSIVHVYQGWTNLASSRKLRAVLADGAIPMIDWYCGDTDANILAGNDDALITAEAQELASLRAPLLLRWYWEPNFPSSADYAQCIGSLGPAGYAAAFRHIHDLFVAAGASNVAFVFSMATSGNDQDLYAYYPGSAYVDWIAADGYMRTSEPPATGFVDRFGAWYSDFAAFGKPMMISETAAFSGGQSGYLQQIENQVGPGGEFPLIKAVMYFDAPGNNGLYTYPLDPSGLKEFTSLSTAPMFQPARSASTVTATASPTSSSEGQQVVLSAQVSNTDFGGSTSFLVNGTPLPGCQSLLPGSTSTCKTTGLPVGSNEIVAVYSGDAEVAGSTANAISTVRSTPSLPAFSRSPAPHPVFVPFLGVPDIGGVASLGTSGGSGAPFTFPLTLSLPAFAAPSRGGAPGPDPLQWLKSILHGRGGVSIVVLSGGVLLLLLGTYMVSTWTQDRRRERRGRHALGSSLHAGTQPPDPSPGSLTPEEASRRS